MKITKVDKSGIEFDNGLKLTVYHEYECCENVYADFSHIQVLTKVGRNKFDITTLNFHKDILNFITLEKGVGFSINSLEGIQLFVSCYSIQNGYYSTALELRYNNRVLDIESCVNCQHH